MEKEKKNNPLKRSSIIQKIDPEKSSTSKGDTGKGDGKPSLTKGGLGKKIEPDTVLVEKELEPWTGSAKNYKPILSEEYKKRAEIKFKLPIDDTTIDIEGSDRDRVSRQTTAQLQIISEDTKALEQKLQRVRDSYLKEKKNGELLKRQLMDEERKRKEIEIKLDEIVEENRTNRERLEAEIRILESESSELERKKLHLEEELSEQKAQLDMEQEKRQALQKLLQENVREQIEARKKQDLDIQKDIRKRMTSAYKLQEDYWEKQIEAYEKQTKMLEQDKQATEYILEKTKESLEEKKKNLEEEKERAVSLKRDIENLKRYKEATVKLEKENQELKNQLDSLSGALTLGDLKPGTKLAGTNEEHYEIIQELKSGGMGQVYTAKRLSDDQQVVIKTMISSFGGGATKKVMRFVQEARTQMTFDNPNVVKGYDFIQTKDSSYLAMEFVEGETVESMLERDNKLDIKKATDIVYQMSLALEYLENLALIHRDIKPSNIIVTPEGVAKLADFGIVKMTDTKCALTTTGIIMGTPYYVSPEQLTEEPLDIQSDVYSLGATFYHMLVGDVPFKGKDQIEVLTKRLQKPPRLNKDRPDLPKELTLLIDRMMDRRGKKRPRPTELVQELKEFLSKYSPGASGGSEPPKTGEPPKPEALKPAGGASEVKSESKPEPKAIPLSEQPKAEQQKSESTGAAAAAKTLISSLIKTVNRQKGKTEEGDQSKSDQNSSPPSQPKG